MPPSPFELISTAAFSNLWYWVTVALLWARVAQAPMGIPLDQCDRALAAGDEAGAAALLRAGVARALAPSRRARLWMVGLWACALTLLLGLAALGSELAQALFLLAAPLALAQGMILGTAMRMASATGEPPALAVLVRRLRIRLQLLALASIFVSAVFGMNQVLARAYF
ncbi:component of SufBCD complex [Mangrovicoccus algicola]|uniref:Component of SufBCD complex n=1 Tax=Mangrovicoccus algicola TaxID=2771008 RepID=A0A8J6Z637_9RHOB|nr:component of SufBCD complex [Mangrovicoccus algicola]MBE3638484.1 component of SufBCD complex [Mangrovicoccus algicola]